MDADYNQYSGSPSWHGILDPLKTTPTSTLPTAAAERKTYPIATGVLDYFPDAIAAVAHVSYVGNEQHNPGEPLHWAREKSTDQEDTMLRHFLERGTLDKDGLRHSAKMVWRALAILQLEIEASQTVDAGAPGSIVYYHELGEVRASAIYRPACGFKAPENGGKHPRWTCEREVGHTGDHMAWEFYETRELYEGGRWPQQPTPLQNCPRPGGAF